MMSLTVREKIERIQSGTYPKYTHIDYANSFIHSCIRFPCEDCQTVREELIHLSGLIEMLLQKFNTLILTECNYDGILADELRYAVGIFRKIDTIMAEKMKNTSFTMGFKFIKRIATKPLSIFYSAIHYKNEILGFGRNNYGAERLILPVKFNEQFDIIEECEHIRGEDPRCFIHNGDLYVIDNYLNDMYLYDYERKSFIKIGISGKNLSYVSHNGKLYFMHYIKPFILYEHNLETNTIIQIQTFAGESNHEYRGGTPGYRIGNTNKYFGFGHRTYWKDSNFLHDVFLWVISFEKEMPELVILDVEKPPNAQKISDPTCVITIDNKHYMITAESQDAWFIEQDYITNVYEFNMDDSFNAKFT